MKIAKGFIFVRQPDGQIVPMDMSGTAFKDEEHARINFETAKKKMTNPPCTGYLYTLYDAPDGYEEEE